MKFQTIKPSIRRVKEIGLLSKRQFGRRLLKISSKLPKHFDVQLLPQNDLTENINVEAYVPNQVDNTIIQSTPQNVIDENASESCPTYEHQPITDQTSIIDQVRNWAVKFNVTHNCANSMLNILRSQQIDIPKDIRTVLRTPKTHLQTPIQNGSYIHLGFVDMVFPIIIKHFKFIKDLKILKLSLNIDGLPLSKSSKNNVWPILLSIINFPELKKIVIPVRIYHGLTKKPGSVQEFLDHLYRN